jgi:transposase
MQIRRTYRYRLHPSCAQIERLEWVLERCRDLYNVHVAKSISDAGWNHFLTILTHKAEETGVVAVVVNPAGTSHVCSGCGRSVPKILSDRWHTCPYEDGGLSLQRDHNSARAILNRVRVPACGSPVLGSNLQHNHLASAMGSVNEGTRRPWTSD